MLRTHTRMMSHDDDIVKCFRRVFRLILTLFAFAVCYTLRCSVN